SRQLRCSSSSRRIAPTSNLRLLRTFGPVGSIRPAPSADSVPVHRGVHRTVAQVTSAQECASAAEVSRDPGSISLSNGYPPRLLRLGRRFESDDDGIGKMCGLSEAQQAL